MKIDKLDFKQIGFGSFLLLFGGFLLLLVFDIISIELPPSCSSYFFEQIKLCFYLGGSSFIVLGLFFISHELLNLTESGSK